MIKTKLYETISNKGIPIVDHPTKFKRMPYGILRTINKSTTNYKNFATSTYIFRLDIFSNYSGEKTILDYYNTQIKAAVAALLKEPEVIYIDSAIDILDDDSLGTVNKHGIITFKVEAREE